MASDKNAEDNSTPSSSSNAVFDLESLRKANFDGKIPIKLVLAQTSLSSGVPPQPQHVLVSRQTFLHVGLESAVRKLHEHALPTLSFLGGGNRKNVVVVQEDDDDDNDDKKSTEQAPQSKASNQISSKAKGSSESDNDKVDTENEGSSKETTSPYPICWFEDIATGQPLRWQYFCGVLFDSLQCTKSDLQNQSLPWEIRLHFRSYPSQQLLELCDPSWGNNGGVLDTLRQTFRNSLKQAFVIRYGNSKEALNLSKQAHDSIWEGITKHSFDGIASVVHRDDEFVEASKSSTTTESTEKDETEKAAGEPISNEDATDSTVEASPKESIAKANNLVMLPIRLSVDPTKPMVQKRFEGGPTTTAATLDTLFLEWVPSHFESVTNDGTEAVQPKSENLSWRVAGLSPPLSTPLLDLWLALKHPDNFLYISLSIPKQ